MKKLTVLAPAKINLTFDILGTQPDGYHEVETILQSVDLQDQIHFDIEPARETKISISTNRAGLPIDDDNLIAKAAHAFANKTGHTFYLKAELDKAIPVGAGLAGGSADAAATLAALNEVYFQTLHENELEKLGATVGADVPFAIAGGTKFGTKRGDFLTDIKSHIEFTFCIVKPATLSISTPWAYSEFDKYQGDIHRPNTKQALHGLAKGDVAEAMDGFANVFQPMIFKHHPELAELMIQMRKHEAWHVQLSGSGPALFAICPDLEHAHFLRRKLFEFAPDLEIHFCNSTRKGAQVTEYLHGKATC